MNDYGTRKQEKIERYRELARNAEKQQMKMNKNQIFKDVQKWLFKNHQHYHFSDCILGDRKNEPIVFSLDFEKWFREYLEVDKSVNWYGEEKWG